MLTNIATRRDAPCLTHLCVFCASSHGHDPVHQKMARHVGELCAREGITIVYGGARVGLMGILADAALRQGGAVIGVIPAALAGYERAHQGLTELHCVKDMYARKRLMAELSDACLMLPGGIGTLDEFFEFWTAAYIGTYRGPVGIVNVDNFYTPLLHALEAQVEAGFLSSGHHQTLVVDASAEVVLQRMRSHTFNPKHTMFAEQRA